MASAETQKRDRAMSWEDKEAAAVKELVASLPAWEGSLEPDTTLPFASALRTGALDCGLRYYHRRNAEPRDRVELVVAVRAGSIDERDEERGLAHVLEHLAFRAQSDEDGSWGVLRELEAHGVKFGSHQNASWAPSRRRGISDDDADKERAIVLEEWRQGKDWAQRAAESHFRFTFAGSRLADRLPIGSLDVVRRATAETLRDFYERHYVAENMAVVVVGDVPAETDIAQAIDAAFSKHFDARRTSDRPWPRRGIPRARRCSGAACSKGRRGETPKLRVNVYEDAEATSTAATLSCCRPFVAPATVAPAPRALVRAPARLDAAEAGAAATADALRGAVLDFAGRRDRRGAEATDDAAFFGPVADEQGQVVSKARHDLPGLATPALELRLDNGLTVVFLRTDFRDDEVALCGAPGGLSTVYDVSSRISFATADPLNDAATLGAEAPPRHGLVLEARRRAEGRVVRALSAMQRSAADSDGR
ncbi:M16 peptidase-like protein [Aureococcus anophagefferens]|nr:M16 peptidase-like protein [Aureococcus anophagefferens]